MRRRAAAALGLAVATALMRTGGIVLEEVWTWRGVPDTAHAVGKKIDVEAGRRADAVEAVAKELGPGRWDGATLVLRGRPPRATEMPWRSCCQR